jgi:hypothetical protein
MSSLSSSRPAPNRVAVFGPISVPPGAGERPPARAATPAQASGRRRSAQPSPAASAVLERVHALLAAKAPGIARPILDRALAAGTITDSERSDLLEQLSGAPVAHASERAAVARLHKEILAAVGRAAPTLAEPLLKDAVSSERLTAAQEGRILERLRLGDGCAPPLSSLR